MEILTRNTKETEEAGKKLAARFAEGSLSSRFFALYGDLGVGKTALVRGFCSVLAPDCTVKSPTYTVVNQYPGKGVTVCHFDMYRIEGEDDLYSTGFDEYANDKKAVLLCEWSEKIPFAVPEDAVKILIEKNDPSDPESRRITVKGGGIS